MAIPNDSTKIQTLWKQQQYGVTQTSSDKSHFEEFSSFRDPIIVTDIWKQSDLIPTMPGIVPGVVSRFSGALKVDPSVDTKSAWIAVSNINGTLDNSNRIKDFISPSISPAYEISVYTDVTLTNKIINTFDNTLWVFDYINGILWFPNTSFANTLTEVYITGYYYVGEKGLNPTFSGGSTIDVIQTPSDGTYAGGYVTDLIPNVTTISDAIDKINTALWDFSQIPLKTIDFTYMQMPGSVNTLYGANIVLSDLALNNTSTMVNIPEAGSIVDKVVGMNLETNYIGPFGNGNIGNLSANLNDSSIGNVELTYGNDTQLYGNLEVNKDSSNDGTYGNFYSNLIVRVVNLDLPLGLNGLNVSLSDPSVPVTRFSNTLWLVRDSLTVSPTVTNVSLTETDLTYLDDSDTGTSKIVWSSGIPHYGNEAEVLLSATIDNLATDLHLDTKNVEFGTVPVKGGPNVWAVPGSNNLPSVLTKGLSYTANNVIYKIGVTDTDIAAGSSTLRVTARNANGESFVNAPFKINFIRSGINVLGSPIFESGVPIDNLGVQLNTHQQFAKRIPTSDSLYPSDTIDASLLTSWNSKALLQPWEAAILGGSIVRTSTNFSNNYYPIGPDYSENNDIQYITFAIQRKDVSIFRIEIEGRYTGLNIKLPGITNMNLAPNGWLDAFKMYDGWGTPGKDSSIGCAFDSVAFGGTQNVIVTFGLESSSNSTDNIILVRFKLTGTDKINSLKFSGVQ